MLSIKKILVPVDFSDASAGAVRHAVGLSRHFVAEIELLHVFQSMHFTAGALDGAYIPWIPEEMEQRARQELDRFLADELDGETVRRVFSEGDPARRIVEFAESEKVDLIAMPTRGYGPFRRFILGSVTAKVLHDAESPVWTGVHLAEAPTPEELRIQRVLCAVDLSEHSRTTLCWAARFAGEFGARLGIVHAAPALELAGPGSRYFVPEWRNTLISSAAKEIARLQQEVGTTAEVYVDCGDVETIAALAAKETSADILIIGRSPAKGRGRLRSNGYAIVRESPCPVISV
jgi:nucleotide-binding universal stress UspA family protein